MSEDLLTAVEEPEEPFPYSYNATDYFPDYTHNAVGLYLAFIGVLGTIGNGTVLAMFFRFRSLLTPTTLLLINLAVADLGMSLGNCPFSSSSSFAHRWLYGDGGCQWYAFTGFLFGTAHIGTLAVLAVDRYIITCKSNYRGKLTYRRYYKLSAFIWVFAAFWAVMPLIGWARYSLEPSVTTCTIDWRHNDVSYKSFLIVYFLLGYAGPLALMVSCYTQAARHIRSKKQIRGVSLSDQWANDKSVTYMCVVVLVVFVLSWTPYAILCLWTVFGSPSSVPPILTLMPPLFAKGSTIVNPFIYYASNPRLRAGLRSVICCCRDLPGDIIEMPDASSAPVSPTNADDK